jgi:hypothetical protein
MGWSRTDVESRNAYKDPRTRDGADCTDIRAGEKGRRYADRAAQSKCTAGRTCRYERYGGIVAQDGVFDMTRPVIAYSCSRRGTTRRSVPLESVLDHFRRSSKGPSGWPRALLVGGSKMWRSCSWSTDLAASLFWDVVSGVTKLAFAMDKLLLTNVRPLHCSYVLMSSKARSKHTRMLKHAADDPYLADIRYEKGGCSALIRHTISSEWHYP